jgi:hypothetical protein
LRRATMIITITTNRTPAMMRIVVGSIEALSLRYMRHRFRYGLCRVLPNLDPAFEPKERHKSTLKTVKQQAENQMIDHSCVTSVPSQRGRIEADRPLTTRRYSERDPALLSLTSQPPRPA